MQVDIGRARLQPIRQIHVRSPRSQSPQCLSSSGTWTVRSQAWTRSSERARWERNICSREKHNQPPFSLELTARAPLRKNTAHNDILAHNMLVQTILVQLLYESSATSSTSTSSEEDRRSVEPSLRGKKPWGELPIPESRRWIWW